MSAPVPYWWRQMLSAVRLNAADDALRIIATSSPSPMHAAQSCADWLRVTLPYRFDGPAHRILTRRECAARGYGACGDAVAAIAATLLHTRAESVSVAYEAHQALEGYAHVRVVLGRVPVDPWPEQSLSLAPRAVLTLDRESVRWPVDVDEPHR